MQSFKDNYKGPDHKAMTEEPQTLESECDQTDPAMRLCHSCAHVLGAALCELYPCTNLAFGLQNLSQNC